MEEKLKQVELELAYLKALEQRAEIRLSLFFDEDSLESVSRLKKQIIEKHNEMLNLRYQLHMNSLK